MHFSDFKSTSITLVKSEFDYDRLKLLFLEFATSIDFDLNYKNFLQELASVSEVYASPSGIAFILSHHNNTIGCVGILKGSNLTAQVKRLYVRNIFRNNEYARQLLSVATDWAMQLGMRKIRFTASDIMYSAVRIFESNGFQQLSPAPYSSDGEPIGPVYERTLISSSEYLKRVAS